MDTPDAPRAVVATPVAREFSLTRAALRAATVASLSSSLLTMPLLAVTLDELAALRRMRSRPAAVLAQPAPVMERCAYPTPEPAGVCDLASVKLVGDERRQLMSSTIDCLISTAARAVRPTRFTPEERNGRVVGVRLRGVREGDALDRLGFASGDVVTHVAGRSLSEPDHALSAYSRVRASRSFDVRVERAGQERVLRYDVVDG